MSEGIKEVSILQPPQWVIHPNAMGNEGLPPLLPLCQRNGDRDKRIPNLGNANAALARLSYIPRLPRFDYGIADVAPLEANGPSRRGPTLDCAGEASPGGE